MVDTTFTVCQEGFRTVFFFGYAMARPRRFDPEELRHDIVEAARQILREQRVHSLSARSLASRIGIAVSAIYRHFPTMSDILMEVNRATFIELNAVFDQLPLQTEAIERLLQVCNHFTRFMQDNPNLWLALFEGKREREAFPGWYSDAIRSLMDRLAGLITEVCPQLSVDESRQYSGRLYVLVHGAIALQIDERLDLITPLTVEDITQGAVLGLIAQAQASHSRD